MCHDGRQRWLAHICRRGDHIPSRFTKFAQLFVGHLPEPRSQAVNVQVRQLNGLHSYHYRQETTPATSYPKEKGRQLHRPSHILN
jgi:hypothetical protein